MISCDRECPGIFLVSDDRRSELLSDGATDYVPETNMGGGNYYLAWADTGKGWVGVQNMVSSQIKMVSRYTSPKRWADAQ